VVTRDSPRAPDARGSAGSAEARRIELSDGVRLHALCWEPSRSVEPGFLLVHGLASNALLWTGVAERLADAGHRVVAVDQRAHGRSDPSDALDHATLAADLVAVMAALDLERPIAVGQSWGGNVVLELAAAHPDAVRAVAAVDGGTIDLAGHFASFDDCWDALRPPTWDGVRFADLAARIDEHHPGWPTAGRRAQLGNLVARPDGTAASVLTRERHRLILQQMWDRRPAALYPHLNVPVLLLPVEGGDAAWTRDKRTAVAAAEAAIPRCRTVWFRERHHDVHAQAPDEVAATLLAAVRDGSLGTVPGAVDDGAEVTA
jgi:pimeloyl-ACP methyl ester carboxylesterase